LPATANEHYQSGFSLPGMGNPNRRFLFSASTALQVMEANKCFNRDKVVFRGNDVGYYFGCKILVKKSVIIIID